MDYKKILNRMTRNIKPFLKYYRKIILALSALIIVAGTLLVSSVVMAYKNKDAAPVSVTYATEITGKEAHPNVYEMFYGSEGWTRNSLKKMFDPERYKNIEKELEISMSNDGATITLAGGKTFSSTALRSINNVLVMFGFFLALVTFGYGLFNQMLRTGGQPGLTLVNMFVHLIIVLTLVVNGRNIALGVVNIGSSLTSKVVDRTFENTGSYETLINDACDRLAIKTIPKEKDEQTYKEDYALLRKEERERANEERGGLKDNFIAKALEWLNEKIDTAMTDASYFTFRMGGAISAWIHSFGVYIGLCVPKFSIWLANIFVKVLIYSRSLEVLILSAFAPIAFGFMSEGGLSNSTGIRYIKNLLALSLQGVIIIVILTVSQDLMITFLASDVESLEFVNCVIMAFVEAGMVKKSFDIAQKIVGLA